MKLNQLRQVLLNQYQKLDYKIQPSAPLIHPYFPMSFNMSAGFVQLEPYIRQKKEVDTEKIVTIQKCIRHFDRKKAGRDKTHLTFFEMWGALTLNKVVDREAQINQIWTVLINKLGLKKSKLAVTVFGGDKIKGKKFSRDKQMLQIWEKLDLKSNQVFIGDKTNTFWFQNGSSSPKTKKICGYQAEIFYLWGEKCCKNCSPFCECSAYLEISNNLLIDWIYDPVTKKLSKLTIPATETVIGLERLAAILQNKTNVWQLEEWGKTLALFSNLNLNQKNKQIIIDKLKTLIFLCLEDIPKPGRSGRQRLVRSFIREILSRLYLVFDNKKELKSFLTKITEQITSQYKEFYPNLDACQKKLVKTIMSHDLIYRETIRHAKESIKHAMLRGEIKDLDNEVKTSLQQEKGIPVFLIDKYFGK